MIKNSAIDMTTESIPKKMILFALPLILSSWLQLSFNLADYIVCGQFVGESAVGAIGETGSLSSLIVDLFIGFSIGVSVVMGNAYGAKDKAKGERTVGSAISLAVISGLILMAIGMSLARILLNLMGTPEEIIDMSVTYMTIYFAGIPFLLIYNFGSAAMRSMGDTLRPFIFLSLGGVINVGLNLLFVIPFKMGIAGLAYATIISEGVSAVLVVVALLRNSSGFAGLSYKNIRIYKDETLQIIKIGIPAGIQSATYDIANVLIQSNINSFGTATVSGDSAAARLTGYVYCGMDGFAQAAIAFIAANYGAGKKENIKKCFKWAIVFCCVSDVVFSAIEILLRGQLLGLIVTDAESLRIGELNILITVSTHILMALVDVLSSSERGLGYSTEPAIVSFLGICVLRITYIYTIFQIPQFHNMTYLYATYPISWLVTAIAHGVCCFFVFKKSFRILDSKKSVKTAQN